jgi:hypothetical protein
MYVVPDSSSPSLNVAWPADYELDFYDHTVATTPYNKIPVNYLVINLSTGDTVKSEVLDKDKTKTLTTGDDIVLLQTIGTQTKYTWRIHYLPPFDPSQTVALPQAGDKFRIYTKKPFQTGDYFTFTTKGQSVNNSAANKNLANILVVPNPYISTATWEARTLYATGRGDRKIDFTNLPARCTIRIYTISGALIKTLYKDASNLNNGGAISWNLVSDDGMDIAYGLYLFHVDAPGIGEYIGKFAVIK